MALILKRCFQSYENAMDRSDPRLKDYYLMGSPVHICFITVMYVLFVYQAGPAYMKNKKPMQLKNLLIGYNIIQIFLNGILIILGPPLVLTQNLLCAPIDYNDESSVTTIGYMYFLLKVLDYLDTVFFILKKNFRQVTFLHVYHHIIMVISTWMAAKYFMGGHSLYAPYINVIVHAIMYSYYLLTVIYPEQKNNLTLKKRITEMQLVQFVTILAIYIPTFFIDCGYPRMLSLLVVTEAIAMILLFGDFYYKTYIRKKQVKKAM